MRGWYDIPTASKEYVCASNRTIEMWIKEKDLRVSRVRGKRLIKKEWLDEFLERHESSNGKKLDQLVNEAMEGIK